MQQGNNYKWQQPKLDSIPMILLIACIHHVNGRRQQLFLQTAVALKVLDRSKDVENRGAKSDLYLWVSGLKRSAWLLLHVLQLQLQNVAGHEITWRFLTSRISMRYYMEQRNTSI